MLHAPVWPHQLARNPKVGEGGGSLKEDKISRQAGVSEPIIRDRKWMREVDQGYERSPKGLPVASQED